MGIYSLHYKCNKNTMPNFDKSGPTGQGPTGLRRGGCEGTEDTLCPQGRGFGRQAENMTLEEEEKVLEERLEAVRKAKAEKTSE